MHHSKKGEWQGRSFERVVGFFGAKTVPGVRFTFSNGIYNPEKSCQIAAEQISRAHGRIEVSYVHHPSVDFWTDVRDATRFMLIGECPHAQATAYALSQLWYEKIKELQKETDRPTIIHYGHSFGSVIAYMAGRTFPYPESLNFRLFGSPWLLPPNSFGSVKHIVATGDPVTWLNYLQFRRRYAPSFILEKVPCRFRRRGKNVMESSSLYRRAWLCQCT